MDPKLIARYLGALSIEERVQILQCLLDAGDSGMEMLDIAARCELGPAAVFKQIESLTGLEIVFVKTVDNNKMYVPNTPLINELFECMHQHYGAGFRERMEATALLAAESQDAGSKA
jgi:hypothetical protein